MASLFPPKLQERLVATLPRGANLTFHYIQSKPASCDSIFAAAPDHKPEPTTWASHFLSAAALPASEQSSETEQPPPGSNDQLNAQQAGHVKAAGSETAQPAEAISLTAPHIVQIFALEILVYRTPTLTTVFVSKADSTGLLGVAKLPQSGRSIVKRIAQAFLEHLVEESRHVDQHLVLSLFARAQSQYLFPGSIENAGKHVLDDRQLIRWWSAILDGVLAAHSSSSTRTSQAGSSVTASLPPQAYLMIPGLDAYETRTYWPRASATTWQAADPLRQIAPSLNVPPRCLVPRFPDDPKARFALDLDEELPENGPQPANSPVKNPPGEWRSVRSLEQFWELMAYRQECSAGRVVGFLWGVFEANLLAGVSNLDAPGSPTPLAKPNHDHVQDSEIKVMVTDTRKVESVTDSAAIIENGTADTAAVESTEKEVPLVRAEALMLDAETYSDVTDILSQLDYAGLSLAAESTKRFTINAAKAANAEPVWGVEIRGEMEVLQPAAAQASTSVVTPNINTLGAGLIRKRKKPAPTYTEELPEEKKVKAN